MTYVREQSSTELAMHMRSLQKMPGWHDPLADRLWQEVEALEAEVAGLKTGYEAYERVNAELKAEVERLNDEYDKAWRHDLNDKKNVQVLAAEVARLSAENESLRKDAERWRFFSVLANDLQAFPHAWGKMTPEKMDAMCDQAMADAALGQGEQS